MSTWRTPRPGSRDLAEEAPAAAAGSGHWHSGRGLRSVFVLGNRRGFVQTALPDKMNDHQNAVSKFKNMDEEKY